jgi:G:T-mismatch repair DNA endonuclease (very short patch repair protein)
VDVVRTYPYCCCLHCNKMRSSFEREVHDYLESVADVGMEITYSDRKVLFPMELDIVLPELKIAIECNGTYWHSNKAVSLNKGMSAEKFHRMKMEECGKQGYSLFFVWEHDWKDNRDEVIEQLSMLLSGNEVNSADIPLLTKLSDG